MGTANFYEAIADTLNDRKTLTTNGAVAYATSGHALLDMNFSVASYRNASKTSILNDWYKAYYENKVLAMKWLFYLRDVRQGLGERRAFRIIMEDMVSVQPETIERIIPLVAEYGRYDDLWVLLDTSLANIVVEQVRVQWLKDVENMVDNKPISLLAKWLPSCNTSSKTTRHYSNVIRKGLNVTQKEYRQLISSMRAYLKVVEQKMCAKEWSEIDYNAVPSQANIKYNSAFLRNDEERRREYLSKLASGDKSVKIHASTLQPHEIVNKYNVPTYNQRSVKVDETLEELWKALPQLTTENILVVRDGSGSMTMGTISPQSKCRPLDVATALAIYASEHTTDAWKDRFITFSSSPKIINLSNCKTLLEKLKVCYREDDCSNTNIYKTMKLILTTAVKHNMTQEDMPDAIVILSDMQFDGRNFHLNKSLFEDIAQEFKANGYNLPKMVFWNLNARYQGNKTVPMQKNEFGLILASGFSVQIMQLVIGSEDDAYKALVEVLSTERYEPVAQVLWNCSEI